MLVRTHTVYTYVCVSANDFNWQNMDTAEWYYPVSRCHAYVSCNTWLVSNNFTALGHLVKQQLTAVAKPWTTI